ncbi:hypothetical protein BKA62DRAFT_833180 [Auriculariales sp. MPI-PUGE-AT-0066]|nr:hypothetical protein BKA62DRAFT_833180 [Auriculariales sp. MPI-PUGE-AT-0066]
MSIDDQSNQANHTSSQKLPPDQTFRKTIRGGRLTILSVADEPLKLGLGTVYSDFSPYSQGTYIFSESIGLVGDVRAPYGIHLATNTVLSSSKVTLNTSGSKGNDQAAGVPAQHGTAAGPIDLYVQNGSDECSAHLRAAAQGGSGGKATEEDGLGGDGGPGGNVFRFFQSYYAGLGDQLDKFISDPDVSTPVVDAPIQQTDRVYRLAQDLWSTTIALPIAPTESTALVKPLADKITDIDNKKEVRAHDILVAAKKVRYQLGQRADTQEHHSFASAADCSGGAPGAGKGVRGRTGKYGPLGSQNRLFLSRLNVEAVRKTTWAFAHPEQCAMLLERAETYYYMGSPKLRAQAQHMFQRILNRLSFLPLAPTDPLAVAYSQSAFMGRDALDTLERILKAANNQLTHIHSGMDYNGYSSSWVPRANYSFYTTMLEHALSSHSTFEQAYVAYHTALDNQQELQDAVGMALDGIEQMNKSIAADMEDLMQMIQASFRKIDELKSGVELAQRTLNTAFERLQEKVTKAFDISVPQLVNALTMFAFSPNKGMGALQGFHLIYQGFSSVPDVDGIAHHKSQLVGKITQGSATVQSIKTTLSKNLDGEFQLDDPLGTRLMTAEEELQAFLANFATSSFAGEAQELDVLFKSFCDLIIARNKVVLDFNIRLKLYLSKRDDAAEYARKANELRDRVIRTDDPNLATITGYMGTIYQASRARVMKLLNLLVRSLNFRMLKRHDLYDIAFKGGFGYDSVPLSVTTGVLRAAQENIRDELLNAIGDWGTEPQKFPTNFDDPNGKRVPLTKPQLKQLLMGDDFAVSVDIKPSFQEDPQHDFTKCCNVRIYRVRFVLEGLVAKQPEEPTIAPQPARVTVTFVHNGKETLVDRLNSAHYFEHDSLHSIYSFKVDTEGKMTILDNGNIGEADVNNRATSYAAPGPFTSWRVSLKGSEIERLDLTKVTRAYFDFCGTNYSF